MKKRKPVSTLPEPPQKKRMKEADDEIQATYKRQMKDWEEKTYLKQLKRVKKASKKESKRARKDSKKAKKDSKKFKKDSMNADDMALSTKDSKRSRTNESAGTVMSCDVLGGLNYLFRLRWSRQNECPKQHRQAF